jgi:hypothetical protein
MSVSRFSTSSIQSGFEKFNSIWDGFSAVGAMEPISAITLTGTQSSIEFNNIPGIYMHLQIRGSSRSADPSTLLDDVSVRFNNDTGNNYSRHTIFGDGSTTSSTGAASSSFINIGTGPRNNATSNIFGIFIADVLDYASVNKNKTVRSLWGCDLNGSGQVRLGSGVWMNSGTAITSLRITAELVGFVSNSTFTLYGIR